MAANNLHSLLPAPSATEIENSYTPEQMNTLAREWAGNGMRLEILPGYRDLVAICRDLQPHLQAINDPLLNAINGNITTAMSFLQDTVANINELVGTANDLQNIALPPEAVAIINRGGENICQRTAGTIGSASDLIRRNQQILSGQVERNEQRRQRLETIKKVGAYLLLECGVVLAASTIISTIGPIYATMSAVGMTSTQSGAVTAAAVTTTVVIGRAAKKDR